ncbi:MAG: GNAT family N-acetyltransferase [Chloroflexi bacterium]|nr:GNAT family N-acetyltransferase [Chloroflexota bacterium]
MLQVRAAQQSDRALLNHLLHSNAKMHTHLDWHSPQSWLGKSPFHIATHGDAAAGALAAPPDPPDTSWIRFAAINNGFTLDQVFDPIWLPTLSALRDLNVKRLACMLLDDWFVPQLKKWGFDQINDVIVLSRPLRAAAFQTTSPLPKGLRLRPAKNSDLNAIFKVDAAFDAPWHYSKDTLMQAMSQVEFSSVAELQNEIVGYQISSGGKQGGHLARLAVNPKLQGRGVGRALMMNIAEHFDRLGAPHITVNTQCDNFASLKLYRAFGFRQTGEHYPVWQLEVGG